MLNTVCKGELEFDKEMQLNVSPCSFWKALHDGQPCMALTYNGKVDNKVQFSEFINDVLAGKQNVLKACCVHLDNELSDNPILRFEPEQSLMDFCTSCDTISEVDQLTILRDVAVEKLNFWIHTNMELKVPVESIFVHKENDCGIRVFFTPLYHFSHFPQINQSFEPPADYQWIKEVLILMCRQDQCDELSKLPKNHILYNIFTYKWFSDDKRLRPKVIGEVAKDIAYILGKYLLTRDAHAHSGYSSVFVCLCLGLFVSHLEVNTLHIRHRLYITH